MMSAVNKVVSADDFDDESDSLVSDAHAPLKLVRKPVDGGLAAAAASTMLAQRQSVVLTVIAEMLDAENFEHAATDLVNTLQHELRCDRVALAVFDEPKLSLAALSQQAVVDTSTEAIQQLLAAMQEACDQENAITHLDHTAVSGIDAAHYALAAGRSDLQIHTVPMYCEERLVGVLLYELSDSVSWSAVTVSLFNQLAAACAPLIALRRRAERTVSGHASDSARLFAATWLGPRYLGPKLLGAAFSSLLLVAAILPVQSTVVARAEVMAQERRIISAPITGFINTINASAGDVVKEGDQLLSLDTRDLDLQAARLESDVSSARTEFRSAMAEHDRKAMAIAQAQIDRARAERDLITTQLERAVVRAPSDGVVVSDNLQQAVGALFTRGNALLELAPALDHELTLLVDESDIADVAVGQSGALALKASPGQRLAFNVRSIRPVAEAGQGQSRFRVIADLDETGFQLMPGQTGFARLQTGETRLLKSWTLRFNRWIKRQWWEWFG